MEVLQTFLDILRYTIPALVVYFLMRQFIRGQMITEQMKIRATISNDSKALRIQAYERLTLFCERINIMSLIMRLNNSEMESGALKNAMLISIQKEYEHNLTQQIYISDELWQMISLLKDNAIAAVTQTYVDHEKEDKTNFTSALMKMGQSINNTMGHQVRAAIRKEVELYFQ